MGCPGPFGRAAGGADQSCSSAPQSARSNLARRDVIKICVTN